MRFKNALGKSIQTEKSGQNQILSSQLVIKNVALEMPANLKQLNRNGKDIIDFKFRGISKFVYYLYRKSDPKKMDIQYYLPIHVFRDQKFPVNWKS